RACFGWRMYLGGPNRVVSLTEVLTTSKPAEQVIAGPETVVSADKTTATTKMLETVQDGVLQRSWCIIPGDPPGTYTYDISIVGLPKGQMGNSEVGHMNLGAGRVAVPDLPRIDHAIEDGSLARNPVLTDFIATLKKNGGTCHLMGLTSPGGVHAHQDHLIVLANLIATAGVPVAIHAFLDGRDMPPRSALECVAHVEAGLKAGLPIRF